MEVNLTRESTAETAPASLEAQFEAWVASLSVLDQHLVRDCSEMSVLPQQVMDLFRYSPVFVEEWLECDPPYGFYPEPLLRALGKA